MILIFKKQQGFSLIEMIVSLAVFSIVVTISVGALLTLISTNEQLQGEQSVMTNLSFALDSMTREIRTGTNYFCVSANNVTSSHGSIPNIFDDVTDSDDTPNDLDAVGAEVSDCHLGRTSDNRFQGLTFKETGDSITETNDRILYFFDESEGKIFRRIGTNAAQSVVSSGIYIENAEFFVTGSKKLSSGGPDNEDQSAVTIFIEAYETSDVTQKPYRIQTTVTQRTLDI